MGIQIGSLAWVLLLWAVSEPGEWTPTSVADDAGRDDEDVQFMLTADQLKQAGVFKKNASKLWPTKKGFELFNVLKQRDDPQPIKGEQLNLF